MITIDDIKNASNTIELDSMVEEAASDLNCGLDSGMSYAEQSEFFAEEADKACSQSLQDLADILNAAETKWAELEA